MVYSVEFRTYSLIPSLSTNKKGENVSSLWWYIDYTGKLMC